jgi:hypothetical protein
VWDSTAMKGRLMVKIGVLAPWFPHDMLTIAAVCLGGLTIAATLYVFFYDYARLTKESRQRHG